MGKKSKFIDKSKAITFKLVNRDVDDPNFDPNKDERVFQIVQMPDEETMTEKERKLKDLVLTQFSEKDQGIYDREKVRKQKILKEAEMLSKSKDLSGKDLWIHHLTRMKAEQIKREENLEDIEIEDIEEEEEEWEEIDEEEDEDFDREYHEQVREEFKQQSKKEMIRKIMEEQEGAPDYSKIKFSDSVKMRKFDQYGIPIDDTYDYSQHIFSGNTGEVVAVINADYKRPPPLKPDLDYQIEEMTREQREVFEALEAEEDGIYEELEDDFVTLANGGEDCIVDIDIKPKPKKQKKKQDKKVSEDQQDSEEEKKDLRDRDEDGDDLEDMESEEFEDIDLQQAMEEFEETELKSKGGEQKFLTEKQFESILDEHLQDMKKDGRDAKKQVKFGGETSLKPVTNKSKVSNLLKGKGQKGDNSEHSGQEGEDSSEEGSELSEEKGGLEVPEKRTRGKRFDKRIPYESKDDREKRLKEILGDDLFTRKHYEMVSFEKDYALHKYMEESGDESQPRKDPIGEDYQRYMKKKKDEDLEDNIVTKSFNTTNVLGNLNVIQDNKDTRKEKKQHHSESESEEEEKEDELNSSKMKNPSEVFVKRNKNETKEEKKQRKEQIKEFKKQRKEKKQEFKNGFAELTKAQVKIVNTQTGLSLKGVSVTKM